MGETEKNMESNLCYNIAKYDTNSTERACAFTILTLTNTWSTRGRLHSFIEAPPNRHAIIPIILTITMTTVIMIITADTMITIVAGCGVMGKYVNAFS